MNWEKHNDFYEAEVDVNDSIEATVRIDALGKIMMQKQDISIDELAPGVAQIIQNRYKDYLINDVEKVVEGGLVYYQVELNGKVQKDANVVFTAEGREEKNILYWD